MPALKADRREAVAQTMNARSVSGAVVLVTVVASVLAPAASAGVPRGRFGVGDSIMLSAEEDFLVEGTGVNAEVGRQFDEGLPVVRRLARRELLPRHLIVHLGTNGPVDPASCETLVALAPRRQIYLVNVRVPRWWQDDVNGTLRACARTSDRVHYLNWYRRSELRLAEWVAEDGHHLTAEGRAAYADWIQAKVDAVVSARRAARAG